MSDIKTSKDALVSALFELSKAAQDAASATVNFYKVAHDSSNDESLTALASAINSVAPALELVNTEASKETEAKTEEGEKPKGKKAAKDGAAAPEKKKRKVEKDPNAPKKPLTIYFAFSFHTRETIREERKKNNEPPLSAVEMNEIVKERWNSISAEEKSQWQKKYQNELKEYQKAKEAYQGKLDAEKAAGANSLPAPAEKPAEETSAATEQVPVPASPATTEAAKKSKESKKRKSEGKKHEDGTKKKKEKGEKKKEKSDKEKEK